MRRFTNACAVQPTHLDYVDVLEAIKLACHRSALKKMMTEDRQPMPPMSQWLLGRMEAEWCAGDFQGAEFWAYATSPVPVEEEGRRCCASNAPRVPQSVPSCGREGLWPH